MLSDIRGSGQAPSRQPSVAFADASVLAIRQLRHQTKKALQILVHVDDSPLRATVAGSALAVQRRIMLSARISDALFGLVSTPNPFELRLTRLADATLELLTDGTQTIEH